MKVIRDGKEVVVTITVEEMKSAPEVKASVQEKAKLGVSVRPLNDEEKKKFENGLVIVEVTPDSPAEEAGLKAGDILIKVGGKTVKTFDELKETVAKAQDSLPVLVDRQGQRTFVPIKLKPEEKADKK